MANRAPVAAVSVAVYRGDEVLLVKRARPPLLQQWAPPGGKINWRETAADAARREVREETGVACAPVALIDVLDWISRDPVETHHLLVCYAARWLAGEPRAASDADEARFVKLDQLDALVRQAPIAAIVRAGRATIEALSAAATSRTTEPLS